MFATVPQVHETSLAARLRQVPATNPAPSRIIARYQVVYVGVFR